jgi:GTPase SAR1 family protein
MMISMFKNLFKKEEIKVKPPFYDIVCPYCFEKYQPEDVVFRAAHHLEDDENYALQEDEELNKYRAKFGMDSAPEMEAVLHPKSIHDDDKVYADGVLTAITDSHGIVTRKRLCPACHNELPINAGKVPSNIISIVGASSVGKSVYMTSLIHTLQNTTAYNFNAACMPLNADVSRKFKEKYEDPIFENGRMLQSTRLELQEPYIFQLIFKNENQAPLTLVFFDVPGEGMVDQDFLSIFASHIKNSAGILFLVDPLQIKSIRERMLIHLDNHGDLSERYAEPRDVILNLFENFIGHQDKGKTSIPTAVILTKSDLLNTLAEEDGAYIQPNSNLFNNYVHTGALNLIEFENINGEVRRLIEKIDRPFKDALDVYFTNTAFFAVSALGTNPVNKEIAGVVNPIRVDEPVIWLLNQLGYIEGKEY